MAAALCILATLGSLWVLAALPVEAKTAAWIAGDRCDMRLPRVRVRSAATSSRRAIAVGRNPHLPPRAESRVEYQI